MKKVGDKTKLGVEFNIFKAGTAKYYKDVLKNIYTICKDYDGYNPKSVKQMKSLVDEMKNMALSALKKETQYIRL